MNATKAWVSRMRPSPGPVEPEHRDALGGDLLVRGHAFSVVAATMLGLVAAGLGLQPRLLPLVWAGLVGSVVVGVLSEALRLPGWARDLSPFTHAPQLPGNAVSWPPLLVLVALAALLVAAGLAGFARRDLG